MLTRRRVLGYSAVLANPRLLPVAAALPPLRLAIIGTTYHYGSDLQILADRQFAAGEIGDVAVDVGVREILRSNIEKLQRGFEVRVLRLGGEVG